MWCKREKLVAPLSFSRSISLASLFAIETKTINKLCVREILSLSFECGAYFFEFRGRNLVCFVIAYNFNGKFASEAGKIRRRTAFFTRVQAYGIFMMHYSEAN